MGVWAGSSLRPLLGIWSSIGLHRRPSLNGDLHPPARVIGASSAGSGFLSDFNWGTNDGEGKVSLRQKSESLHIIYNHARKEWSIMKIWGRFSIWLLVALFLCGGTLVNVPKVRAAGE